MNECYFMECDETKATPADVPFVNLLSNSLTTNDVSATLLQSESIDLALPGVSPVQYSRLQYQMCERSLDSTTYSIPIPPQNVYGSFKGPVAGLGTSPTNYGAFEIEYVIDFTSTVGGNQLSIFTQFGTSGIGIVDLTVPTGSSLLCYKLYFEAFGGSATTQQISAYATLTAYSTGISAYFSAGGIVTLQDLTLPMRPLFNIRSNQLPTAWTAARRRYTFRKL